jgi:hypothetical protein
MNIFANYRKSIECIVMEIDGLLTRRHLQMKNPKNRWNPSWNHGEYILQQHLLTAFRDRFDHVSKVQKINCNSIPHIRSSSLLFRLKHSLFNSFFDWN